MQFIDKVKKLTDQFEKGLMIESEYITLLQLMVNEAVKADKEVATPAQIAESQYFDYRDREDDDPFHDGHR